MLRHDILSIIISGGPLDHLSFVGLHAALLTPLREDRSLNISMAQRLMLHLVGQGLDGVYVAGTTGEGTRLSLETRRALVEGLMAALPLGKRLIVHVGTPAVRDAIQLAEHAAAAGAHAVSSLPPTGNAEAVHRYYQELAAHSPLPVILYHFPKIAPHAFQKPAELFEVCDLPNVLGVKFTDFNLHLMQQLVKRGKLVFNGYDEVLAAGLLMGAQGGIGTTYNLLAAPYIAIARAAKSGDWERARTLQSGINDVLEILFRYPFFPAVRAAVSHLGFDCGPMMSGDDFASAASRLAFLADMDRNVPPGLAEMMGWTAQHV